MRRSLAAIENAYALLLTLFPRPFHEHYASEMHTVFCQALRTECEEHGLPAALGYAARECSSLVVTASREHLLTLRGRIAGERRSEQIDRFRFKRDKRSPIMTGLLQDVRLTFRTVCRSRGFAGATVATLTIGFAVNVVLFSMLHAVRSPDLPYAAPDRIVVVNEAFPQHGWTQERMSLPTFIDVRADARSFEAVAAYAQRRVSFTGTDLQARVDAAIITSNLWSVLDVRPMLGRSFADAEDRPGAAPTLIISAELWRDRFGRARDVLDRTVWIDGVQRSIVGVMPAGFRFPERQDLWLPLGTALDFPGTAVEDRRTRMWEVVGRLRADASFAGALEELRALSVRIAGSHPDSNRGWTFTAVRITDESFRATGAFFGALQVGGVLLVLILCSNIANLLLARGEQRRRELAICASLGASRSRLVRLLMLEIFMLAFTGLVLALLLAQWAIKLVPGAIPEAIPFYIQFRIDTTVVLFAVALCAVTAVVSGVGAALRATTADPYPVLVSQSSAVVGAASGGRMRTMFLFLQTTVAAALLGSALVLGVGLMRFHQVDLGFDPSDTLLLDVPLPAATYADPARTRQFSRALLERLGAAPDVRAVAVSAPVPLFARPGGSGLEVDTPQVSVEAGAVPGSYRAVSPRFFAATGTRILSGRSFTTADASGDEPVVILSREGATRFFKTQDVLGRRIRFGRSGEARPWRTVIGVVADTREQPLDPEIEPRLFVPFEQEPGRAITVTVRSAGAAEPLSRVLIDAIRHIDPALATETPTSAERRLALALWPVRFFSAFAAVFSAFGLVVAGSGVYGITRYLTLARSREIALRLALGATPGGVFMMVARQHGAPVLAGLVFGLAGSFGLSSVLQHVMVGLAAFDILAMTIAVVVLTIAAAAAIGLPASRATRVHLAEALRNS